MNSILLFSLLGAAASALDFQGAGQIRTWNQTGTDLGCLTKQAQWTVDETQCDSFSGKRNATGIYLTASTGVPCGIDNVKVVCQDGLSTVTSTWGLFYGGSPYPDHDVLGFGEYGLMASTEDYVPTKATDAPVTIEFWGDTNVQPFVWLTWKAT
ncbi:uncharacterized protein TRUGW13939_03967 [Talaromyces rugulosus]|uniref:Uncharacterized protein n=1 Tax=Talaromyces rugulosus TaxID=121627 RepID=A0A7H8QSA4_TALRU|nr:uncharacterized protein TRUGW13939_03967 [Talaromyces rugulosus]QKX56860.1 hypothetical protein TRUGW13939_03967 [Talaromyces rugulosus]